MKQMKQKEWKHRGKVSIGVVCVILGILLALQYKSVRENSSVDDLNSTRVQTLQTLLDDAREDIARLEERNESQEKELQEYREAAASDGHRNDSVLLEELDMARQQAGLTELTGPGIEVVLEDSNALSTGNDEANYLIHDSDILSVVNELRDAGAEALALNGNRILATTEIRCSGSVITVNGRRTSAPFVVSAIGDPDTMFNALMMRNGVVDILKQWSIGVTVTPLDSVLIPAYDGTIQYEYAVPLTEENLPQDETEVG